MSVNSIIVFVSPVAILCAAGIAWFANYHVQHRLHRHLRLIRSLDDLKGRLREFVDLSADYWTLDSPRSERHRTLEAHLVARKRLILGEFIELNFRSPRLSESFPTMKDIQKDLWSTATGSTGAFRRRFGSRIRSGSHWWQPKLPLSSAALTGRIELPANLSPALQVPATLNRPS